MILRIFREQLRKYKDKVDGRQGKPNESLGL